MVAAPAWERYLPKVRGMEPRLVYLDRLESAADHPGGIADLKYRTIGHQRAAGEIDAMSGEPSAVREAIDHWFEVQAGTRPSARSARPPARTFPANPRRNDLPRVLRNPGELHEQGRGGVAIIDP